MELLLVLPVSVVLWTGVIKWVAFLDGRSFLDGTRPTSDEVAKSEAAMFPELGR